MENTQRRNAYVSQLTASEQDVIAGRVRQSLEAEGLPQDDIEEAVQNALNSRISDLDDVLVGN